MHRERKNSISNRTNYNSIVITQYSFVVCLCENFNTQHFKGREKVATEKRVNNKNTLHA